jgi:hypothetical protein
MSIISANTLFHFTSKLEYLELILENNFSPRFCLEDISGSTKHNYTDGEMAFPMVCFCDIPLSLVTNHSETYGEYAIGLTKEWALKNSIAPLLYYYKDSPNFDAILNIAESLKKLDDNESKLNLTLEVFKLGLYSKLYEGKFFRNGKYTEENVRFYDEREWRYVPDFKLLLEKNVLASLMKKEFLNKDFLAKMNQELFQFKLKFEPKDIRYIIVKDENQILPIVDKLKKVKSKYSYEDVQILTTRIMTSKQLREDF